MKKVSGLGAGKSNEWQTPRYVFDALKCQFDLDVAAPVDGPLHVPANAWFSKESLEREWTGFVWMNPPFGGRNGCRPWLQKFFRHGNGIALTPDRTSSSWFIEAWQQADAILFCRRTPFLLPNGVQAGNPAFGTALWATGQRGITALETAASTGFGLLAYPRIKP